MAEPKPVQIFLCHASEDKATVMEIYNKLHDLGYKPWLDKIDLLPGQYWKREIPKAIRASDIILIFLSRISVAKRGYVQNEYKLALDVLREIPEGTIYVIPVRLNDCTVPEQFGDFHWCDLFEGNGLENLLRALPPSPQSQPEMYKTIRVAKLIEEFKVHEFRLRRVPQKRIGLITGDISGVKSVDIWVNPTNTEMDLGGMFDGTISAFIRYFAAKKDDISGLMIEDTITRDLGMVMQSRRSVSPAIIIETGPGELEKTHNVKKIFHAAATQGEIGIGYRPILNIENCITNALAKVDHEFPKSEFRSILFPFSTNEREVAKALIDAAINYLQTYPQSSIEKAFYLTRTDIELEICERILQDIDEVVALP